MASSSNPTCVGRGVIDRGDIRCDRDGEKAGGGCSVLKAVKLRQDAGPSLPCLVFGEGAGTLGENLEAESALAAWGAG